MEKCAFKQLYKRELGFSLPKTKQSLSEVFVVPKLNLYKLLQAEGDEGPVPFSCVEFNHEGDLLYSADNSDTSQLVQFWNWESNQLMSDFESGLNGINDLKVLPFCKDKLIMCGSNGQVKVTEGEDNDLMCMKTIGLHAHGAIKAAEVPGDDHVFYTCGRDGCVLRYDLRSANDLGRRLFRCSRIVHENNRPLSLSAPPYHNRLKSIVVNPANPHQFCVGGEEKLVRVYDVRMLHYNLLSDWACCVDTFGPTAMRVNSKPFGLISSLAYSMTGELLVSYVEQKSYVFDNGMGFGRYPWMIEPEVLEEMPAPWSYAGEHACFFGSNDEFVLSCCEKDICIWRKQGSKLLRKMQGDSLSVYNMKANPQNTAFASCGSDAVVNVWAPTSDEDNLPLPAWQLKFFAGWML